MKDALFLYEMKAPSLFYSSYFKVIVISFATLQAGCLDPMKYRQKIRDITKTGQTNQIFSYAKGTEIPF